MLLPGGKTGIGDQWEKYIEATGELSLLAYREEVEACLRTEGMSGLSLLGLQDFPGQGTAIVGMLNSHLKTNLMILQNRNAFGPFLQPFFRCSICLNTLIQKEKS